ncbi:MAG TPA: hypothetical protein VHT94_10385 [Streptosporangiaceae bacterium]|nr:hypothetical protein [Streptosporangiaceae bacterium]
MSATPVTLGRPRDPGVDRPISQAAGLQITGTAQRDAWRARVLPPVEQVRPGLWSVPVPARRCTGSGPTPDGC